MSQVLARAIFKHFIKEIKNLSSCIVELYKQLGIFFKNTQEVPELLGYALCFFVHFSGVLKIPVCYITQQCTWAHFFIFLVRYEVQCKCNVKH